MCHEERCLSTENHDPEIELCLNVCHRIESFEILDQETCSHQVLIERAKPDKSRYQASRNQDRMKGYGLGPAKPVA
jgi:hypothetical protein